MKPTSPQSQLPDILLISVDTMRRDCMAPYGADLMPAATALLAEGTAFDRCVSASPWTGSSFGSMLTGLWPRRHGCLSNSLGRDTPRVFTPLRADVPYLPDILKRAGYSTACAQGNFGYLGSGGGFTRAFDRYAVWLDSHYVMSGTGRFRREKFMIEQLGPVAYGRYILGRLKRKVRPSRLRQRPPMSQGQALVRAVKKHLRAADGARPTFCWLNFIDRHMPYVAPRKWMPPSEAPGPVRPAHLQPKYNLDDKLNEADRLYIRRRYDNTACYVNACIEDLLAAWPRLRRGRERLTIFVSDHGEEFWDHGDDRADPTLYQRGVGHGHTLYNELIRVPMVFHWPGVVRTGRRVAPVVSLVDLTPTVLDLMGIDAGEADMDGPSLAGAITDGADTEPPVDRIVFSDSILDGAERQAAVSASHKLVRCPSTGQTQLFAWSEEDPGEANDLADSPEHQQERQRLSAALDEWNASLSGAEGGAEMTEEEAEAMAVRLRDLGYM